MIRFIRGCGGTKFYAVWLNKEDGTVSKWTKPATDRAGRGVAIEVVGRAERRPKPRVFVVRHFYGYVSMFQLPDLKVFARRQDISSGRSVAIVPRWNIGRLFLAAAYSSTTTSVSLLPSHLLHLFIGSLSTSSTSWNSSGASSIPS